MSLLSLCVRKFALSFRGDRMLASLVSEYDVSRDICRNATTEPETNGTLLPRSGDPLRRAVNFSVTRDTSPTRTTLHQHAENAFNGRRSTCGRTWAQNREPRESPSLVVPAFRILLVNFYTLGKGVVSRITRLLYSLIVIPSVD